MVTIKVEKEAVLGANKKFEKILGSILTLSDDGYTGTNFNRPGFQQMLEDIEAGYVTTVIVKECCAIIGLNQKDLAMQGFLA